MIKSQQQFVSVYDGYAIEMTVESVKGNRAVMVDYCGEKVTKTIKYNSVGTPFFYHGGHCYLLNEMNVAENNRIKL